MSENTSDSPGIQQLRSSFKDAKRDGNNASTQLLKVIPSLVTSHKTSAYISIETNVSRERPVTILSVVLFDHPYNACQRARRRSTNQKSRLASGLFLSQRAAIFSQSNSGPIKLPLKRSSTFFTTVILATCYPVRAALSGHHYRFRLSPANNLD